MGNRWTARGNYWVATQTLGAVLLGLALAVILAMQGRYVWIIADLAVIGTLAAVTVVGVRRGWFTRDQ